MTTKLDARQSISRDLLDQLTLVSGVELDNILRSINEELTVPLRIKASSPADLTITIENIALANPETGVTRTIPPIGGSSLPTFTSGTVVLPATTGGTITVTPGVDLTLTLSNSSFIKLGLSLDLNGNIVAKLGTEGASAALAGTPTLTPNTHSIGYIVIESDGSGNVQTVGNADIFQYVGGGAGSGSGSGQGEINYIENPSAEFDDEGWELYADAAAATPVDGTGGTSSLTFERSTTLADIIRGDASFKITKAAANEQGEGVSYDFEIDAADKSKLMKIEFEYLTSANYASGDVAVFIYDVTNTTLITPSVSVVPVAGSIQKFVATWSSTTSTSYRLILHVASTSTLAYTFGFDSVIVGPGRLSVSGVSRTEFLSNSQAVADTDDASSFQSGAAGATILAHAGGSGNIELRVQASAVLSSSNKLTLEVSLDGNEWFEAESVFPYVKAGSDEYGMALLNVTGSNQQVDVVFYKDGATPSDTWSSINSAGWKWRLRNKMDTSDLSVGYNYVQYLWNSTASVDTDNTAAFSYGEGGTAILAHTGGSGNIELRVQAQQLISPSDHIQLQVSKDGNEWLPAEAVFPRVKSDTQEYGMNAVQVTGSNQTLDVVFYKDGATPDDTWSSINSAGWKWRLLINSAGAPVGFGYATQTVPGLVSTSAQTFGGDKTFANDVYITGTLYGGSPLDVGSEMRIHSGSLATPAIGFSADDDGAGTGIYRVGANSLGFAANGANIGQYSSGGAWTFGPTGNGVTHTFRGGVTCHGLGEVIGLAGSPNYTRYDNATNNGGSGGKIWRVGDTGGATTGHFSIYNQSDALTLLSISPAGALTLGVSGGSSAHFVNGTLSIDAASATGTANTGADDLVVRNNATAGQFAGISILGGADGMSNLYLGTAANPFRGYIQYAHGSLGDRLDIGAGGSDRMSISSAGDVGIGTTAPLTDLHIKERVNTEHAIIRLEETTVGRYIDIKKQATTNSTRITTWNGGDIMEWTDGGLIGIGTTGPSAKLHVRQTSATTTVGTLFFIDAGGNAVIQNGAGAMTGAISSAESAIRIAQATSTSRSINASGTINASGSDYAEYMTKAVPADTIAAGELCGVDVDGLLTKLWSESLSFVVKSTSPSMVGGDTWFNRAQGEEESDQEYADAMEAARQAVDRIAFCGQVPCIVTGVFNVGDWIIPQEGANDSIEAVAVSTASLTFEQFKNAVGKVWKDLGNGKALIAIGIK